MQSLATSKGRVPNILGDFIGDHGTLVIHAPGNRWYYLGQEWMPKNGLTTQQFIKTFHVAPPSNVPVEWWGIVAGLTDDVKCRDCNWRKGEVQAALDMFVNEWGGGAKSHGVNIRTLAKIQHLASKAGMITPAPVMARRRKLVAR